ncbi:DUF6737 family protein [Leptolyngbya sp. Cla-17]|uniref:DUF6737 family protein n=1 Tax=Leptolyngbya sp. Cla-17 TaxID=2803751 RepID=UPI001492562D|nr:DUF6737 family protein [Leptolyngbya sp. Cla-17]
MITPEETVQPTKTQATQPPTVWSYKPWWCQPWSILLTGNSLILGSWGLFHRMWITAIVAIPVLAWMGFFLLVYPQLMKGAEMEKDM